MAKVIPFRGYTYNLEKIDNLGDVMAPPYDSVNEKTTMEYYNMSEYNSIRIISPVPEDGRSVSQTAGKYMEKWIKDKILICDDEPAIYLYEQTIITNGEMKYNRGFVGLLELADYSERKVMPCEEPSSDTRADRYDIIKATKSNSSMISCMFVDRERRMKKVILETCEKTPDIEFKIDGLRQRVWKITYEPMVLMITDFLKDSLIYIVDGHNRYEAALQYKKDRMSQPDYNKDASYNYILAHFCEDNEGGKSQLPVHRLVKFVRPFREENFTSNLQDIFKVEKIIVDTVDDDIINTMRRQIATQRKETKIALYCGEDYFYRLTLKDYDKVKAVLPDKSDVYCSLDITVLNKLIFEGMMHMSQEDIEERISYTRSCDEGMRIVESGKAGCMFVLNPVKYAQISGVIMAGEKMPKRSVCVYPKPATGVIIHRFFE